MIRLVLCALILLVVVPVYCQPGPPSSLPVPSPAAPGPSARPAPPAPPGPPAEAARSAYPQWIVDEFPKPALEYLDASPQLAVVVGAVRVLAKPVLFVLLFLFVGGVFSLLATRAIMPPLGDAHQKDGREAIRARRLRWVKFGVWIGALYIASEAVGLTWLTNIGKMITDLIGIVMGTVGTVFAAAVLATAALAFTAFGRDLLLSLIGAFYLHNNPNRPTPQAEFDLGDGVRGRIVRMDPLHTVFDVGEGKTVTKPNAWLMREHYGWGRGAERASPPAAGGSVGNAEAAAPGSVPPPEN